MSLKFKAEAMDFSEHTDLFLSGENITEILGGVEKNAKKMVKIQKMVLLTVTWAAKISCQNSPNYRIGFKIVSFFFLL